MLNRLKKYLIYGNTYYGIEHTVKDNKEIIFCASIKKSKKEINLIQSESKFSLNEISEIIPKNSGIRLIINNDQVLVKQIKSPSSGDDSKLIYNAFPNINLEEFYYNISHQKDTTFLAICRKQYVDAIINDYKSKSIRVLDFRLGNLGISNVTPYIDSNEINTNNATIIKNDNELVSITKKINPNHLDYDINGLRVSSQFLMAFSTALSSILITNSNENSNFISKSKTLYYEYLQHRFFKQFSKFGLVLILCLLLINFMFFNHYFNQVNELTQISQVNKNSKNQLLNLKEDVTKKEKLVTDLLQSESSKSSFYISDIISTLPQSILMTEFDFQPLIKRVKADKPIENKLNSIYLKGLSSKSDKISYWVSEIEQLNWVEKVVILNYSESNKSLTEFGLKITIK